MRKVKIIFLSAFLILSLFVISDSAPARAKLLASDITVPINTTWVDVTNFTSKQIWLAHANQASLTFYVKGNNAGCTQNVIFKFAGFDSLRNTWDTIDLLNSGIGISVTANGTTAVQKTVAINPYFERIKLLSVQNQETVAGYTVDVNISIFIK